MRIRSSATVLVAVLLAMCASGASSQVQTPHERSMQRQPAADAVKWDLVIKGTGDDGMDAYVDRSSIHRAGRVVRMASLWDYRSRQVYEGRPYRSARNDTDYDCSGMRFRIITARGFTDHMGRGSVTSSSDEPQPWVAINVGSIFHTQWKTACAPS